MIRVFKSPNSDDLVICYDDGDSLRLLREDEDHGDRVTAVPNWWVELTPKDNR